ncbi:hypothetical protein VV869_14730 [Photobacterium sp. MCCC 1A19761]|uniref:hypothetical protein n=1 Tax=Photobacterium sp. MCCC 1A19761 TaxID=3115000 RepID=UPI00307CE8E1
MSDSKKTYSKLGNGVKAYIPEFDELNGPFTDLTCYREEKTKNKFEAYAHLVSSYEHYHELNKKHSGMSLDFGIFKLGHKKERTEEHDIKETNVNLWLTSTRQGKHIELDVKPDSDLMSAKAKSLDKIDFYNNYGRYYISGITTGYYCHVLITITCSSKSEAEKVGKSLNSKITTEDGSGAFNRSKENSFINECKNRNAIVHIEHNLPDHIIKEIDQSSKGDNSFLQGALKKISVVESLSVDKCDEIVSYDLKQYPQTIQSSYAFTDTTFEKELEAHPALNELSIKREFIKCLNTISDCKTYQAHPGKFNKVNNIKEKQQYFEGKLDQYITLIGKLNDNPWADVSKNVDYISNNYSDDRNYKFVLDVSNEYINKLAEQTLFNAIAKIDNTHMGGKETVNKILNEVVEQSESKGLFGEWTICNGDSNKAIHISSNARCKVFNNTDHGRHKISAIYSHVE